MSATPRGALVVMAKEPAVGRVKTRMHPPLSLEQAAALYTAMLEDVLAASVAACRALELDGVLALHPPDACARFAAQVPRGLRVIAQRGASLSERMTCAVAEVAAGGASPVLLRGSDSPLLGEATLAEALAALETADVVLTPDPDGGYGLVGVRRPVPGLFEHAMSTERVLEDTIANAEARGLLVARTQPGFDLDTAQDLLRFKQLRDAEAERLCPRTLSLLCTPEISDSLIAG